jgi:hypothetical protein
MSEPTPGVDAYSGQTRDGDPDVTSGLAELAEEFVRRHRAGERPSVDEYAAQHPELADRIRELFPAMLEMEQPGLSPTLDLAPPTERVGATIGSYKLLERIGEAGSATGHCGHEGSRSGADDTAGVRAGHGAVHPGDLGGT